MNSNKLDMKDKIKQNFLWTAQVIDKKQECHLKGSHSPASKLKKSHRARWKVSQFTEVYYMTKQSTYTTVQIKNSSLFG